MASVSPSYTNIQEPETKSRQRTCMKRLVWCCCCPLLTTSVLLVSLLLVRMGTASSELLEEGSSLGIFQPPAWPQEHTDPQTGQVKAYKEGGRWQNPWMAARPNPVSFFWDWWFGPDATAIPGKAALDETLPIRTPAFVTSSATPGGGGAAEARMTWLGHATVMFEVEGHFVLADPIFSHRASAVQFAGPARYREAACSVDQLPNITAVLISHSHYDHLDLNSVKKIAKKNPAATWFVPQGLGQWMKENSGVEGVKVKEMVWWDESEVEGTGLRVACTPTNHWCKRGVSDDNQVLWASYALLGQTIRAWFGGDTGYCEAFKQIGRQYGPFHLAAIPIGAYQPNWFMKYQHVHPGEAVEMHKDLDSRKSLGIHWGTFKLTTEHYLEPPALLNSFMNKSGLDSSAFVTTDIGGHVDAE